MSATPQVKEIWNLIKETNKQINTLSVETDKLRASQKATDEQIKKTDEGLKKLENFLKPNGVSLWKALWRVTL